MIDINKIRNDFPILNTKVYGRQLVYLDNGATSQKPLQVISSVAEFYSTINSNIHRGVHYLSSKATEEYEKSREKVKTFINAKSSAEVIFTKGTTDSINLVAFSFGEKFISEGDEILVCETEHHSNIVPWQMLCERKRAKLIKIPVDNNTEIIMEEYEKLLSSKTKLVAVAQVSNAFGTIHSTEKIIEKAHKFGAKVLIDGAQSIQHFSTDVQKLDCDFYVFSGHKIYAETGIGVLFGKGELLSQMPPYQGGGDMINSVSFEKTEYAELPLKFEAGTSNYVGAYSLLKAIEYLENIGLKEIAEYETELKNYAFEKLSTIPGLEIIGNPKNNSGVISFTLKDIHFYDAGMILDKMGIAVRTGTHCAEPAMKRFNILGTIRVSFSFYNTKEEIDILYNGLLKVKQMFE
jgi:cysteine desulfurase/selenocysteine lyase